MKNTRKKMLLSSVAMLLVALVALGSATYAWFTINKEVTAKSMIVKAVTTDGLVISNTQNAEWKREVSFSDTATDLKPVSYDFAVGSVMPKGVVAKDVKTGGAWSNGTDVSFKDAPDLPSSYNSEQTLKFGDNGYVAAYTVDVASSGDAINKKVKASITKDAVNGQKDGTSFAKAVLVGSNQKVIGFWTDGQAYTPVKSTATNTYDLGTEKTTASASDLEVLATVPVKDSAATFTLYVWYEGNDPQCVDTAQDSQLDFTLKFTLAD